MMYKNKFQLGTIEDLALLTRDICYSKRDCWNVFSGPSGEGKTTFNLSYSLALAKLFGYKLKLDDSLIVSIDELQDKIEKYPFYSILIPDEAIDIFYKREFNLRERIEINKIIAKIRKRRLVVNLNSIYFSALDTFLIQGKIRFWGYIEFRKYCHIFQRLDHPATKDVWNLGTMNKFAFSHETIGKHPNYVFSIPFKELDSKFENEYLKVLFNKLKKLKKEKIFKNVSELKQFIKNTEIMSYYKLYSSRLLKRGAINWLASLEGVAGNTITTRLKAFEDYRDDYLKKYELLFAKNSKLGTRFL